MPRRVAGPKLAGWVRAVASVVIVAAAATMLVLVTRQVGVTDSTGPTAQRHQEAREDRAATRQQAPVRVLRAVPARRTGGVRPEVPTTSRLPDGTVVPIRPAGIRKDGSLAVPEDIRQAGWWRGGARLGDPFGSTLLAAHVDSFTQGLGPYASLLSVRPGQRVVVQSPHLVQSFAVSSLILVPKGELKQHPSIFSAKGESRLTLVTCAGPYVPAKGGYQNLAVITAAPVGPAVRRSS